MAVTTLRVKVGDNWYEVEVGDLTQSPVQVTVEGETFLVEIEGLPSPPPVRPRRGRTQTRGILEPPPITRGSASSAPDNIIVSPLSGRVISILVRPGESVTAGQEVCVVEAMKMEQSIRATRDGVVKEIMVQPMDSVRTNDPLIELD
ncbi:MAG: biotin/lipoyl-containing protein [Chloroflexota bacterium]|nr:acetyl-CoA carboxylase biotin carboxyl carrier protein subunit [Dehalococcoidia bacterium]MCS5667802.1 acetyl-CoA carboxylase biotin carboxyl carrier protein subunit [Dehalococcoidia bacterium]MEC8958367.1 biotin/lipoyl-containing protein [Chloroflexota bacterium]MEE3247497.1 biotin/lipoyl-containing protein [Chloroflexota bacterium]MEE3248964.1 biotin/lipoyl-containing protein [Chloroflexota bacterium]